MRTSPTVPKTAPTPQRQINLARRSTPMTRNGGDAELIELNQQVRPLSCHPVISYLNTQGHTKGVVACLTLNASLKVLLGVRC